LSTTKKFRRRQIVSEAESGVVGFQANNGALVALGDAPVVSGSAAGIDIGGGKLLIGPSGKLSLDSTDSSGIPGAATVNKPRGQAKVAVGEATLVITNSLVTAASVVFAVLQQVDATFTEILSVVPGAGSFTITGNAAATAATKVGWVVL
jgi:hypothetical protein